ncbi:glycosyltransferase family 4 protein [Iamia sp. SCSIO 61187]|uniref:glycosyltransferase n=1 Tax=Iamia sp. SCSIO 61187 TaxID=2722752 RepID=UPI001C62C7F8|nr:glycosyltransferase [Iamia sp. SCSIO 61187]QYG92254.1 glycosyltransferase family 4 protein [Iamia sp. SCSIO 61187]
MTATLASEPSAADAHRGPRVAYVVSRFPRLTETFVVDEALAVVAAGADVVLHPLHRERADVVQPRVAALEGRVEHRRLGSPGVLAGFLRGVVRRPGPVVRALGTIVWETRRSRRLLVGGLAAFPYAVDLARRLADDGVDHVHCHFATHPAAVGWVVHRLTGLPYSFTAHGSDLHRDRSMLGTKVADAAFVVTVSQANRAVILAECGDAVADKVHVVRCGIDPDQLPRRPRSTAGHPGPVRVCCVGTLHEVKGQATLVDACRLLVDEGRDIMCTLVGDGPDRDALEERAERAGLAGRVRITGRVARPEVVAVLAEADVLVAPSVASTDGRREGLPVVVLEAMAVGVPVVASRLSGIPEAVEDEVTGLLVPPGDPGAVAAAIGRVLDDPVAAEARVERAAERVAADFSLDASARRLVGLFGGATS